MPHHDRDGGQAPRLIGLDYLRGFVIVQVVLHHAVLAYCRFGHFDRRHYLWSSAPIVDSERWLGFDVIVLFNDSYFMPLLFLLSGLFVWPSLERKGTGGYMMARLRRLAVPFALSALTIAPLAYYPSFRMTGADIGFGAFWMRTVFDGPWPSGPAWFLAVLFGFDLMAVALYAAHRRHHGRRFLKLPNPVRPFAPLAALSAAAYLPLLIAYGPSRWLVWGPFAIQASRILLYAAFFLAGVAAGRNRLVTPDAARRTGPTMLAMGLFALLLATQVGRLYDPTLLPPVTWLAVYGATFALFCAGATRALLDMFAAFTRPFAICDSLGANSYGIYLLHYPCVVWGQYALLDARIGAVPKAVPVFGGSLTLSWASTAELRRIGSSLRVRPH